LDGEKRKIERKWFGWKKWRGEKSRGEGSWFDHLL
jgi:hypothetical protein